KSAEKSIIQEITKSSANKIVQAPRVTAFSGVPATIQVRANRTFVTQVAWNGDENAASPTSEGVRVGWHTTLVGRKLDQGILVKMVFEDTEIRGVHKVSLNLHQNPEVKNTAELVSSVLRGEGKASGTLAIAMESTPLAATDAVNKDEKQTKIKGLMDE